MTSMRESPIRRRPPSRPSWLIPLLVAVALLGLAGAGTWFALRSMGGKKEQRVTQLQARRGEWEKQQTKLRAMQARHAGSGLLSRLLDERAKERSRG